MHSQGNFPPKHFTWSRKFSTNKEVFQKKLFFLPQKFLTKIVTQSKTFSTNEDQEHSLKDKNLDPFNTKSYAKTVLLL